MLSKPTFKQYSYLLDFMFLDIDMLVECFLSHTAAFLSVVIKLNMFQFVDRNIQEQSKIFLRIQTMKNI